MSYTKYDKLFNDMLEGDLFQGEDALNYLNKDFTDDELEALDKQALLNLFTKAFILICVQDEKIQSFFKEKSSLTIKLTEQSNRLIKHYQIYPDLVQIEQSDAHFDIVKANSELISFKSYAFNRLVKSLPEIRKSSHIKATSKGGINQSKSNQQHKNMLKAQQAYLVKWNEGYRFPRGTLGKFYDEMADKYSLDNYAIKNSIEKLRKSLGHSKNKKQPS